MVEGKLIPLIVFLGFLEWVGMTAGLLAALGWSVAASLYRVATGGTVPGLLILSTISLAGRTVVALATGSLVVYFLQPTITTALVGFAFLVSVRMDRSLAERLAHDFCPFDSETAAHPMLRRFFFRLSLLWALTSLVNASVTLWLLFTQSITTFVVIKSFLGPTSTAITLGIAALWFRHSMRREGLGLEFSRSMAIATD